MSEHLPDCFLSEPWNATTNPHICICARLRACERRVLTDVDAEAMRQNMAFQKGVQAARDAVAALEYDGPYCKVVHSCEALDAIDALRGESNE